MANKVNPLWDEFILWSLTPDVKRGAVSTETEWARVKGISDRTLRRWKDNADFQLRKSELSAVTEVTSRAEASSGVETSSVDELDYQVVKSTLLEGAKSGNPKFLELYFRTYGKPFVEEEVAARNASLSGEDLDGLVAESVALVAPELLAEALRASGWRVER